VSESNELTESEGSEIKRCWTMFGPMETEVAAGATQRNWGYHNLHSSHY